MSDHAKQGGLPYGFTSRWWAPPWLGRVLTHLNEVMILPPRKLTGMAEQQRTTSAVRRDRKDEYGTRLFANWAGGLRSGPEVEQGRASFGPVNAGPDLGVPESGAFMDAHGGFHRVNEFAPSGPPSRPPHIHAGVPGANRADVVGDVYHTDLSDRTSYTVARDLERGAPPSAENSIPGSFRIPRQFRMGLTHMASSSQPGPPFWWSGGPGRADTLVLSPMVTSETSRGARAIRGILGTQRAADRVHVPAVFTPRAVG